MEYSLELITKLKLAINNKTAKPLTPNAVRELKGKKIQTIYFGYNSQCGCDEFIVGDVIEKPWIPNYEPKVKELLTEDGRETFIRQHFMLGNNFSVVRIAIGLYIIYLQTNLI